MSTIAHLRSSISTLALVLTFAAIASTPALATTSLSVKSIPIKGESATQTHASQIEIL